MEELQGRKEPSNMVIMEMLSERYGFLPSEIRKERVDDLAGYIEIIGIKKQIENAENKKHGR